ncbi:hypothetical protein QJS04_geneDACA019269 [Acorus gramineus]|uniref:Uncharacterized protein n=1 Tax=Acorus gramineus TaxID=55184 RepID=A0AAV9A3H1_ACOGR|nr:hypothetical protein QJS04_geneDACA019269 [Acorus gramineus]
MTYSPKESKGGRRIKPIIGSHHPEPKEDEEVVLGRSRPLENPVLLEKVSKWRILQPSREDEGGPLSRNVMHRFERTPSLTAPTSREI